MLAASQAFAKDKKKDEKDLKIDSLNRANDSLRLKCDSVTLELNKVYIIFKDKIVKKGFDEKRLPEVIDSLIVIRDSSVSGFRNSSATLMDSIASLKKQNMQLKATLSGITAEEAANNRVVNELKQLKDLLDAKILTQSEFDTKKVAVMNKWQ